MEDLRRIGELVDGNVEHLRVLGKYDDCEDEPTLKKRYLQLRVKRASQAAKSLSCEERIRLLGKRRAELLEQISGALKTIGELEVRKETRLKGAVIAERLGEKVFARLAIASANLKSTCNVLSTADPLMVDLPADRKRSTSLEALMREYVAEPQEDRLHLFTGRKTMDVIMEINSCLQDMKDTLLKGPIASLPLAPPELGKLRNIQQVALELARCIIVARSQPGRIVEMRGKMDALGKGSVLSIVPSPGAAPDLAYYAQLRADGLELDKMAKATQQRLVTMTDQILKMNSSFCEWARKLWQLCEELQRALHNHGSNVISLAMPDELHNYESYISLLYIKIRHALVATTPSSAQNHAQELHSMDAQLVSQLKKALHEAISSRDEAKRRFSIFQSECQAIEKLWGRETQALLSSIVIKE